MWLGFYRTSRRSARQQVTVTPTAGGLSIVKPSGETIYWPYKEARKRQGRRDPERQLRLERGEKEPCEILVIEQSGALEEIRRYAPGFGRGPGYRRFLPYAAAAVLLACVPVAYTIGTPLAVQYATGFVPLEMEEQVGMKVAEGLALAAPQCTRERLYDAVDAVLSALLEKQASPRYQLRVVIIEDVRFYSCAVPGGYIVLHHGLVARTRSPEELAGVLAHEAHHVLAGHARRIVFQRLALPGLLAAVTGTGRSQVGEMAMSFGMLGFSESDEREADEAAIRMLLDARIDPAPAVELFSELEENPQAILGGPIFVSSHPRAPGSGARLRELARGANYSPVTLPEKDTWKLATLGCDARPRP